MNIFDFEGEYRSFLERKAEWNYLRIKVAFFLKNRANRRLKISDNYRINRFRELLEYLKNIFFGFSNWFRSYEYLFFSDSSERRLIDGKFYDKLSDDIIEKLDKKSLLIETPAKQHYRDSYTKYIVSSSLLKIIFFLIRVFIKPSFDKELVDILKENSIDIDIEKEMKSFHANYILYKLLLNIYRPKVIFVNCAYCKISLVKVAKDLGIKVVEIQHGVISKVHFGYVSELSLDDTYQADILLSFGENEIKLENRIIKQVIPIGSFYLEYMEKTFKQNSNLKNNLSEYKFTIAISMQDQDWEREFIFDFILEYLNSYSDTLFILIPRKRKDFPVFPSTVMIYDSLDCYNTLLHCDIHMTLYSSCALEAPSLGIPNILLNKKNISKEYFEELLDSFHTRYTENVYEFREAIFELVSLEKREIISKNKDLFYFNYEMNIKKFLEKIKR